MLTIAVWGLRLSEPIIGYHSDRIPREEWTVIWTIFAILVVIALVAWMLWRSQTDLPE